MVSKKAGQCKLKRRDLHRLITCLLSEHGDACCGCCCSQLLRNKLAGFCLVWYAMTTGSTYLTHSQNPTLRNGRLITTPKTVSMEMHFPKLFLKPIYRAADHKASQLIWLTVQWEWKRLSFPLLKGFTQTADSDSGKAACLEEVCVCISFQISGWCKNQQRLHRQNEACTQQVAMSSLTSSDSAAALLLFKLRVLNEDEETTDSFQFSRFSPQSSFQLSTLQQPANSIHTLRSACCKLKQISLIQCDFLC